MIKNFEPMNWNILRGLWQFIPISNINYSYKILKFINHEVIKVEFLAPMKPLSIHHVRQAPKFCPSPFEKCLLNKTSYVCRDLYWPAFLQLSKREQCWFCILLLFDRRLNWPWLSGQTAFDVHHFVLHDYQMYIITQALWVILLRSSFWSSGARIFWGWVSL